MVLMAKVPVPPSAPVDVEAIVLALINDVLSAVTLMSEPAPVVVTLLP